MRRRVIACHHGTNSAKRTASPRLGLTLVEILVATALTLLLVAAAAEAFSIVGRTVATSRAGIEMQGQLRAIGIRLQRDLEGVTVPLRTSTHPASGGGYFEILEGWAHDGSLYPGAGTIGLTAYGDYDDIIMFTSRARDAPFAGAYLDTSGTPSVMTAIQSNLAEIVWWTTLTDRTGNLAVMNMDGATTVLDANANGILDTEEYQQEDFTLYRRALLIRPDLNVHTDIVSAVGRRYMRAFPAPTDPTPWYDSTNQNHLRSIRASIKDFISVNDVSFRIEQYSNPGNFSEFRVYIVANSLDDLTKPEHRFAHSPIIANDPASTATPIDLMLIQPSFPFQIDRNDAWDSVTRIPTYRNEYNSTSPTSEPGAIKSGDQQGEDVVASRLLAFDVRVYDPLAMVGVHPGKDAAWGQANFNDNNDPMNTNDEPAEAGWSLSDDEFVYPGDPGFALPATGPGLTNVVGNPSTGNATRAVRAIGRGAYVDLGYALKRLRDPAGDYNYNLMDGHSGQLPTPPFPASPPVNSPADTTAGSYFSGPPKHPRTGGSWPLSAVYVSYDTWSFHYEHDGLNQDGDSDTDEGINGLDDDSSEGVDDPGERETSPPYPVPLRGVQVRIRMIDHDTRQVRQTTVTADFTPE